jgi:hypothetical protein
LVDVAFDQISVEVAVSAAGGEEEGDKGKKEKR